MKVTFEWTNINDERPEEDRDLFYFFPFLGMYRGKYKQTEYPKELFEEDTEPVYGDCFFGKNGFLVDDVTHWMYAGSRGFGEDDVPPVPDGYIFLEDGKHTEYALESDTVRITKHEHENSKSYKLQHKKTSISNFTKF